VVLLVLSHAAVAHPAPGAGAAAADLGLAHLPRDDLRCAGRPRQPPTSAARCCAGTGCRLLGIGIVTGYLGAAPSIVWASGVLFAAAFFILIPVAIWIYTVVFAFSSLWFAHYCLAALEQLRAEVALAANVPAAAPVALQDVQAP
jgi:hypothetical protein